MKLSWRVGRTALGAVFSFGMMIGAFSAGAANAAMVTVGLTSQPIGHYDFCKANPAECRIKTRDAGPEQITDAVWNVIVEVNAGINAAIKPMNDFDIYGKEEVWTYPDAGVGDCEDYVLEKRRQLMRRGLALSNLLITVVRKPDGEGHAVLTVRTDRGDFILDNLHDEVQHWHMTGYRFLKRQAATYTGHWVSIRDGDESLVAAVD